MKKKNNSKKQKKKKKKKKKKKRQIETADCCTIEASIRVLGMWYICLFTLRGMGYLTFYYQGCGIFETQFDTFIDI